MQTISRAQTESDRFMALSSPIMPHLKNVITRPLAMRTGRFFLFILALVTSVSAVRPAAADIICVKGGKACCNAILFILLLFMIPTGAYAENIFLKDGSIIPDVRILSQDDDAVMFFEGGGIRKRIRRDDILRINSIELTSQKAYVCMRQLCFYTGYKTFYAYLVDKNESVYTFRDELYRMQEYTLKKTDILFVAPKTIAELKSEGKIRDEIVFDVPGTVSLMAAFAALIFAILLFKINEGNRRANRILGFFLLVESIINTTSIYYSSNICYRFPYLQTVHAPFPYLLAPLLYFYVRTLTIPTFRLKPVHILHLLPFVVNAVIMYRLPLIMTTEQEILLQYYYIPHVTDVILWYSFLAQIALYMIPIIRMLHEHRRRIKNKFSTIDDINLSWLVFFINSLMAVFTMLLICFFLDIQYGSYMKTNAYINKIWPFIIFLYLVIIGYKGLTQHDIFTGAGFGPEDEYDEALQKKTLISEFVPQIMDRLARIMDEEKPYLDSSLTLPMLAQMLDIPRNTLSHAINESRGQNFYDYVNSFRVEKVKEHLKDPAKRDMNVLHIAFDAGFNTKATFNSVFKKSTGVTPSAYRKSFEAAEGDAPSAQMTLQ